jgi:protein tyrosine phosphatase
MQRFFYNLNTKALPRTMFSSIFGGNPTRNVATGSGSTSITSSNFSLDAVVADIATAHIPNGTLPLISASRFLEEKLRNSATKYSRLRTEFAALEALQAKRYNIDYDYTVAVAATEVDLNRYVDVLPYEHTRVKLIRNTTTNTSETTTPTPTSPMGSGSFRSLLRRKSSNSKVQMLKEQLATYINASFITCSDTSLHSTTNSANTNSSTVDSWRYIVAQGPLPSTCGTFWEMVVQEKVQSIVMLTDTVENKRKKCHQYFALQPETTLQVAPGLHIYTKSVQQLLPGLVLRTLEIIKDGSVENNYVCDHYHYTAWPDHGVPQTAGPLLLLSYMLRSSGGGDGGSSSSAESPVLVHCSAGIGRSGVFCVVDTAARRLFSAAKAAAGENTDGVSASSDAATTAVALAAQKAVNVGEIVAELRKQRAGMVQTAEQFVFCHTALLELTNAAVSKLSASS